MNYFVTEGSKVGSKTNVYSISQNKLELDDQDASTSAEDDSASSDLTAEEQASIIQKAFVPSNIMMSTILRIQSLTSC